MWTDLLTGAIAGVALFAAIVAGQWLRSRKQRTYDELPNLDTMKPYKETDR